VTALLVGNSQIDTCLTPIAAVGWNPSSAGTKLRENMCQLMSQGSVDFCWMLD